MNFDLLRAGLEKQLTREEGRRNEAYRDTRGLLTIGIGHHDDAVFEGLMWSDERIDITFTDDVNEKLNEVIAHFPWAITLNEPRLAVLVEMNFQMGLHTELQFTTFLGLMRDEHYPQAANDILNTTWAKQTPARVRRLARQIETGEWQIAP